MKSQATQAVAVNDNAGHQGLSVVDLGKGTIPDLSKAATMPFDLMSDYWTPEKVGESKRVVFDTVRTRMVKDMQTGEPIELECAFFFERSPEGQVKTVCNGSKRLLGVIESYDIQRGAPMLITYMGKQKNRTNSFFSDIWSIKPLIINVQSK